MFKFLTGGGLGDALMGYSKIQNICINKKIAEYSITHVEVVDTLLPSINEFYKSQKVNYEVLKIPSWSWLKNNKKKYDMWVDTAWNDKITGYTTLPRPKLILGESESSCDILICIASGRRNNRFFSPDEIRKFINHNKSKKIGLIGKVSDKQKIKYNNLSEYNFINQLNLTNLMNLINDSEIIITNAGFVAYFSLFLDKTCYVKPEVAELTANYFHPQWKPIFINNLNNLII